jgi:hypothetical protein
MAQACYAFDVLMLAKYVCVCFFVRVCVSGVFAEGGGGVLDQKVLGYRGSEVHSSRLQPFYP